MAKLQVEQLDSRICPTQAIDFLGMVNQQWTQLGLARQSMPALSFSPALSAIAGSWAADMAGHGGDGRDIGPQTDTVGDWWTGNAAVQSASAESAAMALANAPTLLRSSHALQAGVGMDGEVYVLITGIESAQADATIPPAKAGNLL